MGAVSVSDVLYHQTCSIIDCSSVVLMNATECKGDVIFIVVKELS